MIKTSLQVCDNPQLSFFSWCMDAIINLDQNERGPGDQKNISKSKSNREQNGEIDRWFNGQHQILWDLLWSMNLQSKSVIENYEEVKTCSTNCDWMVDPLSDVAYTLDALPVTATIFSSLGLAMSLAAQRFGYDHGALVGCFLLTLLNSE